MALTRRSESNTIFLQAKHYCLWQELKQPAEGCDKVEVTNPKTGVVSTKFGFKFNSVSGLVTNMVKYDTEKKYSTRYFGFKLHLKDGDNAYVLDLPYQSQALRRFLRVAPNLDWNLPLSITVFKGKKENRTEELAMWFQQRGETIKMYFTRENPRGMPQAVHHADTQEWDFKEQHRWLVDRLKNETIPAILEAAKRVAPPVPQAPPANDSAEPQVPWDPDEEDIPPTSPPEDSGW